MNNLDIQQIQKTVEMQASETRRLNERIAELEESKFDDQNELLAVEDVCDIFKIGRTTFYKYKFDELIPSLVLPGCKQRRWRKKAVLEYLDSL